MTFEEIKQNKKDLKLVLVVVDGVDGIGKESFSDFLVSYLKSIRDKTIENDNYEINYSSDYQSIKLNKDDLNMLVSRMSDMIDNDNLVIEKKSFPNYETETGVKIKSLLYGVQNDETTAELEKLFNVNIVDEMNEYLNLLKSRVDKGISTILVCDRYISSNLVYMSSRRGSSAAIDFIKPHASCIPYPDVMVIGAPSKYDMHNYFELLKSRGNLDNFEQDKDFLINVINKYDILAYNGYYLYKIFGFDSDEDFDEVCEIFRFGLKWWDFSSTHSSHWLYKLTRSINDCLCSVLEENEY